MKISKLLVNTLLNEIKTYKEKNPLAIEPFLSSSQYWVYPNYGHRLVIVDPSDENYVLKYQLDDYLSCRDNEIEYMICRELFDRRLSARFDIAFACSLRQNARVLSMQRAKLFKPNETGIEYPNWMFDKKPANVGVIDDQVVAIDYGCLQVAEYLDLHTH